MTSGGRDFKLVHLKTSPSVLTSGSYWLARRGYASYWNVFLFQGGLCVQAEGTHPTGMVCCFRVVFVFKRRVRVLLECFLVSGWCLCSSGGYASYWNALLFQGGVCVQVGSMRPTGMFSCFRVVFVFKWRVRILLECFLVSGWCLCSSRQYASYWNVFLFQGGVCVQAEGTHPTGMLSCFRVVFVFKWAVRVLLECFLVSGWCLCSSRGYASYWNAFLFQGGVCVQVGSTHPSGMVSCFRVVFVFKRRVRILLECFLVSGWCLCSSGGYVSYWNVFLFQGGVCVQAGGTHPTGMFSCFRLMFVFKRVVRVLLECFLVSGWCLCSSGGYASYWNVFLFQDGVCVQAGGTHPTGMLSCFRVVFVFKREVRVLLQCFLVSGWCLCSSGGYASYWNVFLFQVDVCVQVGGTHPTGMFSCFRVVFAFKRVVRVLLECFLVSGWCLCSNGRYASYWNVFLFQGGVCVQVGGYASYWNVFLFQDGVCVQVGDTRPTGMFSCFRVVFVFKRGVRVLLECFLVSGWCLCSSGGYASYWNVFLFQVDVCVQAGGTRPTGMFSCFRVVFVFKRGVRVLLECFLVSGWCLCSSGGYASYWNVFLFQGGVCVREASV